MRLKRIPDVRTSQPSQSFSRQAALLVLLLILVTVAVYQPVRHLPFINYDDDLYVTNNLQVQSGLEWDTVQWAFTTHQASNWHPLTWLSHALDWQLFGADPAGPHLVNLLLHTLNVVVLFWVLWRATGRMYRSAVVAMLFALHPVNVQSVAWVAERKNLLSMLFFLLALGAYRWYASEPRISRYLVVAGLFALGLMAKPQVITLPLVLLLWDDWPLRRMSLGTSSQTKQESFSRLTWEKLPLFALAAMSAMMTLLAHRAGHALRWYPLWVRGENAIVSYARYLGVAIWPAHLALFYPHPLGASGLLQVLISLTLLVLVTIVALRHGGYLRVGWLWYLITLLPMSGLVQVGTQAMADRYAYLPFIGLFLMAVWGIADWAENRHVPRVLQAVVVMAVLIVFAVLTRQQLTYWHDSVSLWTRTLQVTQANYIAEVDLGAALIERSKSEEAMKHFRAAAAIEPRDPLANMYIGRYEQTQNNLAAAIEAYKIVVANAGDPQLKARALSNMGYAYQAMGDTINAEKCLRASTLLSP